ncbi:DUF1905 domain-containing protein [Roseivirga sp.]|uniref:DUF1905 domain-containing protein n=1 Tax=Roseivirga sp. TaxID=1964215 RepID=UPI003B8CED4A
MLKFETTLEHFDWNIWGYHLPVNQEITKKMSSENHRRVKCVLNGSITVFCALMPIDNGSYILVNKTNRTKLNLDIGDRVEVAIEKDTSEYGIPIPESLLVLLDQDDVGSKYFHALTPGKQRSLIYLVSKVKSVDKQINKGLAVLDHLKDVQGKLDFKMLNEKIKYYNRSSDFL